METGMIQCLHEEIGFVSKEDLAKYMKFLDLGDILSKYSRMFDSNTGALTFAYLALIEKIDSGGSMADAYRAMLKDCLKVIDAMQKEVNQKLEEINNESKRTDTNQ